MLTCWVRGGALHKLIKLQQLHELGVRALMDLQLLHQGRLSQHALQLRCNILALRLGCLHRPVHLQNIAVNRIHIDFSKVCWLRLEKLQPVSILLVRQWRGLPRLLVLPEHAVHLQPRHRKATALVSYMGSQPLNGSCRADVAHHWRRLRRRRSSSCQGQ